MQEDSSILDSVPRRSARSRAARRRRSRRVDEYLDAVRDVERRIQRAEEQSARELPVVAQPAGIPDAFEDHRS